MRKWEYFVSNIRALCTATELNTVFDRSGQDGWELVSVTDYFATFKREIQDANTTEQEELAKIKQQAKEFAPTVIADFFTQLAQAAREHKPDSGPNSATANH